MNAIDHNLTILSFYKFMQLTNCTQLQANLRVELKKHDVKGTVILSHEGINMMIAGSNNAVMTCLNYIKSLIDIEDAHLNITQTDLTPFQKLKVKVKKEIITFGVPGLDARNNGEYIEPDQWDEIINNDEIITIDTRNRYEAEAGSFSNAINPKTNNFQDFAAWANNNLPQDRNTKIAMFCTGGVRCEKSTAYLKLKGYRHVYHLKGGIINYLQSTKNEKKNWQGKCFVFDDRYAVNDELQAIMSYK